MHTKQCTFKDFDLLMDKQLVNLGEVLEAWGAAWNGLLRSRHPVGLRHYTIIEGEVNIMVPGNVHVHVHVSGGFKGEPEGAQACPVIVPLLVTC